MYENANDEYMRINEQTLRPFIENLQSIDRRIIIGFHSLSYFGLPLAIGFINGRSGNYQPRLVAGFGLISGGTGAVVGAVAAEEAERRFSINGEDGPFLLGTAVGLGGISLFTPNCLYYISFVAGGLSRKLF